jgi:CDP-diglyceride synthetase
LLATQNAQNLYKQACISVGIGAIAGTKLTTIEETNMRDLKHILLEIIYIIIILMPVYFSSVAETKWYLATKRMIVILMVVISTIFAVAGILKPATDRTFGIIANGVLLLYLLIVFISAYKNWPR